MTAVPEHTAVPDRTAVADRTAAPGRTAVSGPTPVPVLQALSWGAQSPLLPCGDVDVEALAQGLARAEYPGGRRAQPYTRAQHAVVVSEAIDTLAGLSLPERRVLAMHAWLAEIRRSELRDKERAGEGKKRVALRTMDIEGLADVFARTSRWDAGPSRGGAMAPGVVAFDESLKLLSDLDAHDRRRLALYGLLAETVLAGLGTVVAEVALKSAGLAREAPEPWVDALRFVRRMADAAVRRDLAGSGEETAFLAVKQRIEPRRPEQAAQRWLARYRVLTATQGERT